MPPRRPHPLLAVLALAAGSPAQEDRPVSLPIRASGEVDTTRLASTGRATLRLHFTAEVAPERSLAVRVELRLRNRMVVRRDHAPPVPMPKWPVGKSVDYDLSLPLALLPAGVQPGDALDVYLGFLAADGRTVVPPLARDAGGDGMVRLASLTLPAAAAVPDAAAIDAAIAEATALASKEPQAAWDQLEHLFRRLDDYPLKARLQKALTTIGKMPPPPLSFEEQSIVRGRIGGERARWLRLVAGRMFDQGKLLGALLLLDEVGGSLQEQADRAVLGALDEAQRATQDRDGIAARVFAVSKEQQAAVDALAEQHAAGPARLEAGRKLAKDKSQRAVARELIRTLEFTPALREEAKLAREQIERDWLADVPPEERAEADAARNHPSWARTGQRVSHRFVLIGPQTLLDGIPDDSLLRFDLAYLYLTDLFGRVPNPDGDRVTVYWKELWDFGGGVGGGKIIDIGNADPLQKAMRVDNGLLYHELTHCIDDTTPVYGGLREGLADFGAAFAQMELGQVAGGRAAMGIAARAFLQDYVERDLEYWRIPNYGPSAGFLLHFVTQYGKSGTGYRWELYRKFFRDYRGCRVKDGRTPTLARAFAFHLVEAFGEAAFADLIRFRWPLQPGDLAAIRAEQRAAQRPADGPDLAEFDGSPVPRDRKARELRREQATLDEWAPQLGVVRDWWVIGPFRKDGLDPDTYRWAPEREVDLKARYESFNNNPTWRRPGQKPVTVDATGWLHFEFSYQDNSAIYALTHVRLEQETTIWVHVRGDDDITLFVDDELIGKHDRAGGPYGPWRPGWQTLLPDAASFPVTLGKGRHKLLLKVRNGGGGAGCSVAIASRNGTPLPGWSTDVEPPAKQSNDIEVPDGRKWPQRFRARFDSAGTHKKLDAAVGTWRTRNGALEGAATERGVEWRKYTVRPGFPKDSPSNLAWLPEKATEQLDAFRLELELPGDSQPPKLGVIVQGDGQRDALSGWTLLLEPDGQQVRAHLERYDQRIYSSDPVPFATDGKKPVVLVLEYFARRFTARLGDQELFHQAPLRPIPGRHRIGIATWGPALRIEGIELRGPVRTR